ncbi:MAG TPA: hypothetical protein VGJ70_00820 [Solirubrobacteraceae bacterium]
MWFLLVLAAFLFGCPTPSQYVERRPGLSCDRATKVAYRTMEALGYTVTDVVRANPERTGGITGTKTLRDGRQTTGRVTITCSAAGAVVRPIEESLVPDFEFSRAFGYSFKELVQRPDVEEPHAATGLEVQVHVVSPQEATLDLGGPAATGATAVRLTVRNNTDRVVAVDPERIELVDDRGSPANALVGSRIDGAIAAGPGGDAIRRAPLRKSRIAKNTTLVGYLIYPAATYREARITIEDVETGESEGFVTPIE